jgi:hypothetical protein
MKVQQLAVALTSTSLVLLLGLLHYNRSVAAQAVPTVLRAQAIELVDSRGQVRAQLNVDTVGGEVVFRLRDANGTIRVKLGASEAGSGLLLADEATEPGVHILAKRTGTFLSVQRGSRRHVIQP